MGVCMKTFEYCINYADGDNFTGECPDYLYPEILRHQTAGLDRTSTDRSIDNIDIFIKNKKFTVRPIDVILKDSVSNVSQEDQNKFKKWFGINE